MMIAATIASSLFIIVIFVAQLSSSLHLRNRFARQSPHQNAAFPQHQQFPPFQQQANNPFGPAQFPSTQAFASKLAESQPAESIPHQTHLQQQQRQQFVANNGPLIRAPDGQFILAATPQQQFIPFQNSQSHQQQFISKNQQQFPPINRQQPPPPFDTLKQQQFHGQPPVNVNPSSPPTSSTPSLPGVINNNNNIPALFSKSNAELPGNGSSSTPPPSSTTAIPTPPSPPVDKSVDLDGDGALSLNEVQYAAFVHHGLSSSVVENLFNEVDHNNDGFLSAIEFNDIRPLVLAKAENAALRYLQNVDLDHNGLLSLQEAQAYILREYGISNRDVERIWRLVVPSSSDEMDALLFSKLRRRVRGMSIRLARQIMKGADHDQDGHIDLREAQLIAFEQEGIGPAEVVEMLASVDDNNDGQLNAPEFADFERIVRARAVETSKKALKVVDSDGSGTLTMEEAKKIAFDHYGFDETTLEPFFAQADENEDGQLDAVEFAGFRSVIRGRAVKNSLILLPELDDDGDGVISEAEAEQRTRREDDMTPNETHGLFSVADQDRNELLDKVELADFVRLVRLTSIKFVADHLRDYDSNRDKLVTIDEVERLVKDRYKLDPAATRRFFDKVDVDRSGDLSPGEIVDFRHEVRRFAQDRVMQAELEEQNRKEMAEIEQRLRQEAEKAAETDKNDGGEEKIGTTAAELLTTTMNSGRIVADSNNSDAEDVVDVDEEEEKTSSGVIGIQKLQKDEPKNGENATNSEDGEIGGNQRELDDVKKEEKLVNDESSISTTTTMQIGQNQTTKGEEEKIDKQSKAEADSSTLITLSSSPSTMSNITTSSAAATTVMVDSINRNNNNNGSKNAASIVHLAQTTLNSQSTSTNSPTTAAAHVKEAVVMVDSIGAMTTKKQKKRRRKTSTTTQTTTTTLAPTTEAAEESYEDEGEEEQADGN